MWPAAGIYRRTLGGPLDSTPPTPAMAAAALATTLLLLTGALLPSGEKSTQRKLRNGDRCYHHSECYSDCCLVDWDFGGAYCAAKGRLATLCLPQTNGAVNIMCPCRAGLTCSSKDLLCPHRCYLI
ncbi:colipase-like protein 2 [Perognathus longimembris pacificus]|uniref:colipase-like protein 2 n=1 Tax=Perognathus longimembris pacificus TaxID=214514 RepID=UPI002018BC74|nr:colipase-like protein 2 [Perognathus longimembris pacificus]